MLKQNNRIQNSFELHSTVTNKNFEDQSLPGFIGKSKTIKKLLDIIDKLKNTDSINVLIIGESGTGKELIARAIHFGGKRSGGSFIPLNCSAIPRELAESTLFGHVQGSFTGAKSNRKGCFEIADKGTLFLDEIGDMDPYLQAKLLRVLEENSFMPVGGNYEKKVDVRILAATNANLHTKITQGTFRQDLYFRLARFMLEVPPLRDRKEDIPLLANHFLRMFASDLKIRTPSITRDAILILLNYSFPGNIRELKNIIEYALIVNGGSDIHPEHLNLIRINEFCPGTDYVKSYEQDRKKKKLPKKKKSDEDLILEYILEYGSINNSESRDLLNVQIHRASYLLKKLYKLGVIERFKGGRWARYTLPLNS